ncbi:hybrid sensor histidine kinase/response regulator [Acetobacter sp.]|jgi:signal transduction histidine kinase/purine-cytosine permease-like protein/FixJ family two-component response regulator|uniref:hybrid sensor histidine kinase/response regulator n=1 Tax=Acetobacter sp. TaxID=440 RepID=UPI0025BDF964|nr:ATP-binding protein [Acetobacter sp.]MCH4092349.1 ATP-binding protein [Acetobacter sp.]MCI1300975.1 ATP-binding protein [Acetobacter sp.]MCI1317253.1 ATP-binding protein [Acetobacter sp.]
MFPHQRIIMSRRSYNRWVADETMEDYALRFTPGSARRWSLPGVANTAFGGVSFLALEMIGGLVFLQYGFTNATLALLIGVVLIFLLSLPISYHSSRCGIDIDLLTRGAGFGYIGSTLTSLVYASFTFMFFAIEGAILSDILKLSLGIPLWLGYILSTLVVIPIVARGFTLISRFQAWTVIPWLALQLLPFVVIAWRQPDAAAGWSHYAGQNPSMPRLMGIGAAFSIIFSVVTQIGEQSDFLRFLPVPQNGRQKWAWWTVILTCGAGWIFAGGLKILAGMFLAWLTLRHGEPSAIAQQPTTMYLMAFRQVTAHPGWALALTTLFIALSQIKINITNAYAGSIAWSNFFSRVTHSHPGRVVWLAFNVGLALLLMEMDIYSTIISLLFLHSTVAASWIGALTSDLVVNKPLGLSPPGIEFRRAYLYDINPVGIGAMTGGIAAAAALYLGVFGPAFTVFAPMAGLVCAFCLAPLIGWATRGRYYLARRRFVPPVNANRYTCVICQNSFEGEDIARCPVYAGFICSLCCSLDSRCRDACKPDGARLSGQIASLARALLPKAIMTPNFGIICRYLAILFALMVCAGGVLFGLYAAIVPFAAVQSSGLYAVFWKTFFLLLLPQAVLAWFVVLNQRSYRTAEDENRYQTRLLMKEIRAHRRTDQQLKKAKERAESANLSKSRFMVGVNHEIRTPLNSIMGYAYLLENRMLTPARRDEGLKIIQRSAEHLSGLIEGLFDISKIEAGRMDVLHEKINLRDFLRHLTDMLRFQANQKNLDFIEDIPDTIPDYVITDQRRLRQILINLLSNAIKFTNQGFVSFSVRWGTEIATFEIRDSGIGIPEEDMERIHEPFQRSSHPNSHRIPGTGLGLTITRLLVQILGGELTISSKVGQGTSCRVRLMLASAQSDAGTVPPISLLTETGSMAMGKRRPSVFVVDDDPIHRGMINDALEPLGFVVYSASNGQECLDIAAHASIDLFLLDVNMPGMSGWQLARRLRQGSNRASVILIISADEQVRTQTNRDGLCDGILSKPISISELLTLIDRTLVPAASTSEPAVKNTTNQLLTPPDLSELRRLARLGHIAGLLRFLDTVADTAPDDARIIRDMAKHFQIGELRSFLDNYKERE